MRKEVPAAVLFTDGTNCHREMIHSFKKAGADARLVHMNELRNREASLRDFKILGLPGGFTHGDDLRSGKIVAVELVKFLGDQLYDFSERDGGIGLGVCNGFQQMVHAGILPFNTIGKMDATLQNNSSGHFQCEWVHVTFEKEHVCVFLQGMEGTLHLPIAHGEGKFSTTTQNLNRIITDRLVVNRYTYPNGDPAEGESPWNPNGSLHDIAAITDPSGHWLGSMPHYERVHDEFRDPNWRRVSQLEPDGMKIIQRMVDYFE